MAAIDTIPNAFWSALNNQNLTDLLPPRWSILVNDAGVQVHIYQVLVRANRYGSGAGFRVSK